MRFNALTSVDAFFYFTGLFMKRKVSNKEVEQFIGDIVEILNKEKQEKQTEYNLAKCQMYFAESVLVNSLNEEQLELHRNYREKRDAFFKIERKYIELL